MHRKGFSHVEQLMALSILSILACVALPMYAKFKQKAMAITPVQHLSAILPALQAHYGEKGSFSDVAYDPASEKIVLKSGVKIGSRLPSIEHMSYTIIPSDDLLKIEWRWTTSSCPDSVCGGFFCIRCANGAGCQIAVIYNDPKLGLNRATDPLFKSC